MHFGVAFKKLWNKIAPLQACVFFKNAVTNILILGVHPHTCTEPGELGFVFSSLPFDTVASTHSRQP